MNPESGMNECKKAENFSSPVVQYGIVGTKKHISTLYHK